MGRQRSDEIAKGSKLRPPDVGALSTTWRRNESIAVTTTDDGRVLVAATSSAVAGLATYAGCCGPVVSGIASPVSRLCSPTISPNRAAMSLTEGLTF
jgi:hypothetical protein